MRITGNPIGSRIFMTLALIGTSLCEIAGAQPIPPRVMNMGWQLASQVHGIYSHPPSEVPSRGMTGGVLEGNGNLGVVLGGPADRCTFYMGRNDFWSVLRGRIMPVGSLQMSVPELRGASYHVQENVGSADIEGRFKNGAHELDLRSWVAVHKNIMVLKLTNPGKNVLKVSALIRGPWGNAGRVPMRGITGPVEWMDVSPEVVNATVGNRLRGGPSAAFEGQIRDVRVFAAARARTLPSGSSESPKYTWLSAHGLTFKNVRRQSGTRNRSQFNCGHIIMPQKQFTVSADINADKFNAKNIIFSAMTGQRWYRHPPLAADPLGSAKPGNSKRFPRKQGSASGVMLYLQYGHLAVNLNGTIVVADSLILLHRWVHIAAAYTGSKLVISVDGHSVGQTSAFPSAAQVIGPQWMWAATHPGDPAIPFDGCAPEGIMAVRVLGGSCSFTTSGDMKMSIPGGKSVSVIAAVIDNRDASHYRRSALALLKGANRETLAKLWRNHLAWWRRFWSKSFIEIPDKTIQSWWYGSLYLLASCSRTGNVAPGLWGNWITSPFMGWQGDYTLDYNYEAPFWAAFPTNHVSLADPYDAPLLDWMGRGAALAKKMKARGLVYYCHLTPTPGWSADNFRGSDQKSDALFAAINCVQRWRYTHSRKYARLIWPFLRGVAEYWDHDLTLVNGRYESRNDAPDETLFGPTDSVNPATTLAFLDMLYPASIDMSRQLHIDAGRRSRWRYIRQHLSPLPIVPASSIRAILDAAGKTKPQGKSVIRISQKGRAWIILRDQLQAHPPVAVMGSSPGMNSLQVVFPAWQIGLESRSRLLHAAQNTASFMKIWYDCNDTSSFYPALADIGYDPVSILHHLDLLITHIGYPSFAYHIFCGGVENEATVPTAVCSMFLQSYQHNIHVFPDWPRSLNARFGNLLACGNFLISSSIKSGHISYVNILSNAGLPLRLENPWPGRHVLYAAGGVPVQISSGKVITMSTRTGQSLLFWPASK